MGSGGGCQSAARQRQLEAQLTGKDPLAAPDSRLLSEATQTFEANQQAQGSAC